ncbi:peroxidase [Hafnia alvei]|uniref:peroxidase n=1 Tax=Hafnia alvei TaxID=569 RepID=UPI001034B0C9|nr:peroxidase [Hafnia alvei]TBL36873.1 peroxidase [Hafnia alvei]
MERPNSPLTVFSSRHNAPPSDTDNHRHLAQGRFPLFNERTERDAYFQRVGDVYTQLLGSEPEVSREHSLSRYDRLSIALTVAQVSQVTPLSAFYAKQLAPLHCPHNTRESNQRLAQITEHARLLAWDPTRSTKQTLRALRSVKLSYPDIVTLSQIIGLVVLQSRLIAGTAALSGYLLPSEPRIFPTLELAPLTEATSAAWRPWLPLGADATLAPVAICGAPSGLAIVLMLINMHDGEGVDTSSEIFSDGYNCSDLLRQPLRELAFLVSARLLGCHRSSQHHARRFLLLSKHRQQADAVLADPVAALAQCSRREQAIIQASLTLTQTPCLFSPEHIASLTQSGMSAAEILELIIALATGAWSQRLLVSLGE